MAAKSLLGETGNRAVGVAISSGRFGDDWESSSGQAIVVVAIESVRSTVECENELSTALEEVWSGGKTAGEFVVGGELDVVDDSGRVGYGIGSRAG